jgi:VCBS repeat-containing protein
MGIDELKANSRNRSTVNSKRKQLRSLLCENLERRDLMAALPIYAPGTSQSYMDLMNQKLASLGAVSQPGNNFNLQGSRWTSPTGGSSPNMGDSATISWSIVPDGTLVNNGQQDANGNAQFSPSNLVAFLDGIYGTATGPVSNRPWFNIVQRAYDNWAAESGLSFIYEPNDDGSIYSNTSRGVKGVRGDMRVGGARIDGDFNTLAFNFFPSGGGAQGFDGDMVIDTADRFYRDNQNGPTGENRGLVNVMMHEIGHGLGLGHVIPIDNTKLMEPTASFAFLGAQHDDIVGIHTLYGDNDEPSDSAQNAFDLGLLLNGATQVNGRSIDRNNDVDLIRFTVESEGNITVNLTPVGQTYDVGPQGGSAASVNTTRNKDLSFQIEEAGGRVLTTVNTAGLGLAEALTNFRLDNAGSYIIRILGNGTETQLYSLRLTLSGFSSGGVTQDRAPRLLSIAPNSGEVFSLTRANVLTESPRELTFRFDVALDASTLNQGIRIRRSGGDDQFGSSSPIADSTIVPAFLGFGDTQRIVVARFSEPLPDDSYRIEVFGADLPSESALAVRNINGDALAPRRTGTDRDTIDFTLELGTKIAAIVPQPVDRSASGVLTRRGGDIEVYFNDGELYDQAVITGTISPNPKVVDPQFYNLIFTKDSVSPNDDEVFRPISISYNPTLRRATLTFAQDIELLPSIKGNGTFRLRIGSNEPVASQLNPIVPNQVNPAADPAGFLTGAQDLGNVTGSFSTIINEEVRTVTNPLLADFPGSNFEPGHRDVQDETHQGFLPGQTADTDTGITLIRYSFMDNQSYGTDIAGRPLFSSISPDQKQRVREVFEFYSAQLGIDVQEYLGPTVTGDGIKKIVVGDMAPNGTVSGPGDVLGVAQLGGELAIMDGAEAWDNTFGYGSAIPGTESFFETALHEIGHLLGLGHTYDLPPGTVQGSNALLGRAGNPLEQVFPGDNDVVHGQHIYRPDNRDVDLYRFVVQAGSQGELRAETFAERLNDSSNLDTYLTLFRRESDGTLTVVAANNDYFSDDSFVKAQLQPGEYFLSVTGKGNEDNNPLTLNSGSGGFSQGRYQLRVDFKSTVASQLAEEKFGSTVVGSALDGDGDGVAGGNFDFWFRAATPFTPAGNPPVRTLFVDKAFTGASRNGSLAAPFNRIIEATSVARPGDIIRLVGDTRTTSLLDDAPFEIGDGGGGVGTLRDGSSLEVPRGVTLMIEAGAILKFGGSRILVGSNDATTNRSGSAIQVLGTPSNPVYFTSIFDESLGRDSNPLPTSPAAGNWGGIEIRNDFDRSQGRFDREREGIFMNTISNAQMRFGGGIVGLGANSKVVSPIDLSEARPLILGNRITSSGDSAISADPNSFEESLFTEPRDQNGGAFVADYTRVGPDIRSNTLLNNSINGLFVRIDTLAGQNLKPLSVPARMNDSEITIVLGENLLIEGNPGGALNEVVGPQTSLLTLTEVNPTGGSTGFASGVSLNYLITYVDRFGQESLPSPQSTIIVAAGKSVELNNLPTATLDYVARKIWRQENNTGAYKLAGVVNRDDTLFVDNGLTLNGALQTLGMTQLRRARRDASLVIDAGSVIKSLGGRIEVGHSATMLAEGTEAKPIVFTSRLDDRYGAAGNFDTNNDGSAASPAAGNWAGIVSRHLGELSIDNALITFGGGNSRVRGGFASFNAIEIHQSTARIANSVIENNASGVGTPGTTNRDARGVNDDAAIFVLASQPVILNNIIRNNAVPDTAAISIDANSLNTERVRDYGRSTGLNQRENVGLGNFGPLVSNNQLGFNAINGMNVRGATLTTESVWDDTDMVHVLQSEIVIPDYHTYGGLRLASRADESLVVKLRGANAGFTATGRPSDIMDRIGGSLQLLGSPGFPVVLTSLSDDTIGAGFDFAGGSLVDTNNDGPSVGTAGSWRSVRVEPFANDRNVDLSYERESDQIADTGVNDFPSDSEDLGIIAPTLSGGDENLRLGVTVTGAIASPSDIDVYRFVGTAGTMVWIDIDQTAGSLDSVVELIDANGQIIAMSNNSIDESTAGSTYSDPNLIPRGRALPMDQQAYTKRNAINGTQVDFLGVNPLDAGLRVSLPGSINSVNNYYIRVRSSNVSPVDGPNGSRSNPARLQDPGLVREGITVGQYKLQLRLQQTQEVPGTTVRFADIRYATTALDILGQPLHSALVGEMGETNPSETSNAIGSAQNIGNVASNDRGAISIAGRLAADADIDYYTFSVSRDSIQTVSTTASSHISVIIDLDYADGQGRANTQISVFDSTGRLVLIADDSNIHDDQPAATKGSDVTDLTRGSQGTRDAYIGPIELPAGTYTMAISNKAFTPTAMRQFTDVAGAAGVRVEPIDSIRRILEERFDSQTATLFEPLGPTTAEPPEQPLLIDDALTAQALESAVPFNLSDVNMFTVVGRNVNNVNPLTGSLEWTWSTNGTSAVNFGGNNNALTDIAVTPGGQGISFQQSTGTLTDANSGTFVSLDLGNGTVGTATSGLITTTTRQVPNSNPATFEVIQVPNNGGNNGVGMVFNSMTFSSLFPTDLGGGAAAASFWGVASRNQPGGFQPIIGIVNGTPTAVGIGQPVVDKNILYRLNSYDGTVGGARDPGNTNLNAAQRGWGAGTGTMAHGFFVQTAGTVDINNNVVGYVPAIGTVSGLASVGTRLYAVTGSGELMGLTPGANARHVFSDTYTIINDPETNQPIAFTSLTAGPRSLVENGINYSQLLFGVSTTGRLYAFNTNGVLQNIFPRGRSFVDGTTGLAGATGIYFSSADSNLFHRSFFNETETGHGRLTSFNNSSLAQTGRNASVRFGYADPTTNVLAQYGEAAGIYRVPGLYNTFSSPGGAKGAMESALLDLRDYSPDDQPYLYFNYRLDTEDRNSAIGDGNNAALDTFRVYGRAEDGKEILLATNNNPQNNANRTDFSDVRGAAGADEFDVAYSENQDAYGRHRLTTELFDNVGWRQARISLAAFAGKRDVRLRFEFNSGGDFRTGDVQRAGLELVAVPGERIADGRTFEIFDPTSLQRQIFEFDLGLVLNVPSGPSVKTGDTITIGPHVFTFSNTAGARNIPFAATNSPAALANAIRAVLIANGYTVATSTATPNVLNVTHRAGVRLTSADTYAIAGADPAIIIGRPGTTAVPGAKVTPVFITNAMSAVQVRDAVRVGLALGLNIAGQETNVAPYRVRGNSVLIHDGGVAAGMDVIDSGPLTFSHSSDFALGAPSTLRSPRVGDDFGPRDASGFTYASFAGQRNAGQGLQIDDIIIGFAERGEMVYNSAGSGTNFAPTQNYEPVLVGGSLPQLEVEQGTYQAEIRLAADYGYTRQNGRLYFYDPVTGYTPSGRSFNTNDRLTKSYALVVGNASQIIDGATFTLSDGLNTQVFEFDVVTPGDTVRRGVAQGNTAISVLPNTTSVEISRAIRDAINSPTVQANLRITAANSGDTEGGTALYTGPRSLIIQLNGNVSADVLGNLTGFSSGGVPLSVIEYGQDTSIVPKFGISFPAEVDFGQDLGDANKINEQGQLIISSSVLRDSATYGLNIDAAAQTQTGSSTTTGTRPYPGVVRNLVTLNSSNVAPGVVVSNNVITSNGTGGIRISGDVTSVNGRPPVTVARVMNNTLFGLPTVGGTGILVEEGAAPTLLNNIISNFTTGISVTSANAASTELGANLYKSNSNNVNPANLVQSFQLNLLPTDPLFIDAVNNRFYLASQSQAIDSSIASLENRSSIEQVKEAVGLATSPIIAPAFDVNGLRRGDDPAVNTPAGQGQNVFIDRGAIDRVDFAGPVAVLQRPLDNDSNGLDQDENPTFVRVRSGSYDFFEILLDERTGTGTDPNTITDRSLILTENGRPLISGVDYVFGFSANSRTIRLTPLAGFWRNDSVYEMTLINQLTARIDAPDGLNVTDGTQLKLFTTNGTPFTLEYDEVGSAPPAAGVIPVPFVRDVNFTSAMMGAQLHKAFRSVGMGVRVNAIGDGLLLVDGIRSTTQLGIRMIPPITDLAANRLQANRSTNSLTQFTLVMPDAVVDYGDAIERSTGENRSSTTEFDNGARHAMYPDDVASVALGQFVDPDLDGVPSVAADADDFDSSFAITGGLPLILSNRGPGQISVSAPSPAMLGRRVSITDNVNNTVVYEFTDNTQPPVANGIVPVNLTGETTASGAALKLQTAILNSILAGNLFGMHSIVKGNVISLGGTASHVYDLSLSGGFVQRVATGAVRFNVPASVAGLAQGQTFAIQDGSGNTVTFQIIGTVNPIPLVAGNTALVINLATATQSSFANSIAAAINTAIANGQLRLPQATVLNNGIQINANDEDGVRFSGLFNAQTPPVDISVTSTGSGFLDAWIDWNSDNDFDDDGEQIVVAEPMVAGSKTFNIVTPLSAVSGYTTARFRLSATGGLKPSGLALGGEVEDYVIEVLPGAPPVAVDDPSSANAGLYRVDEDGVLTISAVDGLLANDSDADSATFTVFDFDPNVPGVQPTVAPANGSLVLQLDGSFVYTPNKDFFGTETFVYQVTDPRMVGNRPATVTITVSPINDVPKANDDLITINEDVTQVWPASVFTNNDFRGVTTVAPTGLEIVNEAPQNLRIRGLQLINASGAAVTPRLGESITLNNNTITYRPASNFNRLIGGNVFIRLDLEDDGVSYSSVAGTVVPDPKQSTSTVTLTIDPVNDQPIYTLTASTISLNEDPGAQTFTNFLTDIYAGPRGDAPNGIGPADDELGNVSGLPGQSVTFAVRALDPTRFTTTGQPAIVRNGTNGNLTFTLAPDVNSNNSGPILVEIIAEDGPPTVQATPRTLTINVAQVNDPPSFDLSTSTLNTVEDAPRTVVQGLVLNGLPGPGTAVDEANQSFTTTIAAVNPQYYSVQPRLTGTGDLEFQLAPDVNSLFSGSLNILITLTDNGTPNASLTKTLTINAADINDAPTFNLSTNSVVVREDEEQLTGNTPTSIPGFAANLFAGPATALDENGAFSPTVPGQQLIFNVISVSNQTLFAPNQTPTIDGSGTLNFITAPDRNGTSIVVVRLTDSGRAGPPPNNNLGPTATFTITVNSINDAPEFTIPSVTTVAEDQGVVSRTGFATGIRPGPATAIDETNQQLTFVVRAEDPSIFSVQPTIQSDGTLVFQTAPNVNNNTAGIQRRIFVSLRDNGISTPLPNRNLSAEQTFTLDITPVNDSPIPDTTVLPGVEDQPLDVTEAAVLAGDLPGPADEVAALQQLRITQIERTTDRGGSVTPVFVGDRIVSFRYAPPANYAGPDIVRYVVTDDGTPQASATGSITIQLASVNDAPQFVPGPDLTVNEDTVNYSQTWATGILAGPPNAQDENAGPNAQTVSFQIAVDNPALFSVLPAIDSAGTLSFSLAKDVIGRAIVDVTAVDSGSSVSPNVNRSGTSKLTININPVNDPPGFIIIGDVSVDEDSARYSAPAIRNIVPAEGMNSTPATGSDEAGQSITLFTTNNNNSLFAVQPTISPSGVLEFVPAQDAFGTAIVSVVGRDSGPNTPPNVNESAPRTFTIVIRPINDAPVAVNDRYNTDEDTALTVNAPALLSNDRDVDLPADVLVINEFQAISNLGATVTVTANGQFTYDSRNAAQLQRLVNGETAQDTFSYTLRDQAGLISNIGTVTITVSGLNDTPVAVNDSFSVPLGVSELLNVLANDRDVDSTIDPRTVEIGQLATHGTVAALATGRIEYRPNPGYRGPDSFTYRVRDSLGALSNEATVSIVVNTAPIALPDSVLTGVNVPVVIEVLRNDSDPDGTLDVSTVSIVTGPDVGGATILADGSIRYVPPTGFFGVANLQYAVSDNEGLSSNIANVSIRITNSLHQNPVNNLDVNADGFVSPIDVLIVVNDLNFNGTRLLPDTLPTPPYMDVNGDRFVSPLDVLELINFINERGNSGAGEGEASAPAADVGMSQSFVNMVPTDEVIRTTKAYEDNARKLQAVDDLVTDFGSQVWMSALPVVESEDSETDDLLIGGLVNTTTTEEESETLALDSLFADEDWV